MKKLLTGITSLLLLTTLAACGNSNTTNSNFDPPNTNIGYQWSD